MALLRSNLKYVGVADDTKTITNEKPRLHENYINEKMLRNLKFYYSQILAIK